MKKSQSHFLTEDHFSVTDEIKKKVIKYCLRDKESTNAFDAMFFMMYEYK